MFRLNGDSNTTNNLLTYSARRSHGAQTPQLAMESSAVIEELCLKDDRYFSLLYKNYDSNSLGHRNNNLSNNLRHNSSFYTMDQDKGLTPGLIDYKQMDAELTRMQRDCENIETQMFFSAENLTPLINNENRSTNMDFRLVGSALRSASATRPREQSLPAGYRRRSPDMPIANVNVERRASSTLLSSDLQPAQERFTEDAACSDCRDADAFAVGSTDAEADANADVEAYKCPVCLNCVRQRKPATTICGHVFCSACIRAALRTTCKCPVCQRMMTTRQILRIYL
ncbi:uncharacterized protein LOC108600652 [Drosophila busckii]|nr:uncharacterized protein LOC108600652 [Drosophila busckii]